MLEIKLTEKEQIDAINRANLFEVSEYEAVTIAQLAKIADYLTNFASHYNTLEFTTNEKILLLSIAQKIKWEIYK